MFAENNRISWSQMHCQCLLAALGMGLIWGIPEFTGREGAVGILIGGVLLVLWSGILRRQMTVFRDPIRYLGKVPAWLIAGIWESYLVLTGGWLVGKVGHLAGEYLVSGVPETLLSLIFVLAALGGSHHVQARGRLAQISWGVAAWLGGILLLLAAVQNSPSLEMVWGDQHLETTGFDWKRSRQIFPSPCRHKLFFSVLLTDPIETISVCFQIRPDTSMYLMEQCIFHPDIEIRLQHDLSDTIQRRDVKFAYGFVVFRRVARCYDEPVRWKLLVSKRFVLEKLQHHRSKCL